MRHYNYTLPSWRSGGLLFVHKATPRSRRVALPATVGGPARRAEAAPVAGALLFWALLTSVKKHMSPGRLSRKKLPMRTRLSISLSLVKPEIEVVDRAPFWILANFYQRVGWNTVNVDRAILPWYLERPAERQVAEKALNDNLEVQLSLRHAAKKDHEWIVLKYESV